LNLAAGALQVPVHTIRIFWRRLCLAPPALFPVQLLLLPLLTSFYQRPPLHVFLQVNPLHAALCIALSDAADVLQVNTSGEESKSGCAVEVTQRCNAPPAPVMPQRRMPRS
jgi:hypothetical protein